MVILPSKTVERALFAKGFDMVIGVDEVGMGCLAGPVVVCAASFRPEFFQSRWREFEYLRDSKLLQPRQREEFAKELAVHPHIRHAIVSVSPEEIDRINIWHAARLGMQRAVSQLGVTNAAVLVDGPHPIPGIELPQTPIVKGDRKVFAIAAASVLAKTHRDAFMVEAAQRYVGYGFEIHKGYGTALHRKQLVALGPSPLHRRSFAPVRALL